MPNETMPTAAATPAPEYPEHEKLKALGPAREAVQHFLDWLYEEAGWRIAERHPRWPDEVSVITLGREQIMAMHFGIDLGRLDDEKRAMIDRLRAMNARADAGEGSDDA